MPFRIDWTLTGNHVIWFLTVLAICGGILLALQTNNHVTISDIKHQQRINVAEIERLSSQFETERRAINEFKAEQRKNLLDLSNTLNEIRLQQAKQGGTKR